MKWDYTPLDINPVFPCLGVIIIIIVIIIITIIIIIIIIIYNSTLFPTKPKEKGKRLHYLRCENSLLNHGNISMLNRA